MHFISNITSSEGILARYSDICRKMTFYPYSRSQLHRLIQDETGLSNEKVRERHIFIMNSLMLISSVKSMNGIKYSLDKNGKILVAFNTDKRSNKRALHIQEKILFLNILFDILSIQISTLFNIILDYSGYNKEFIIIEYFKEIREYDIWKRKTIDMGIQKWLNDKILIRSFVNRYKCMEMWLEDLDLIRTNIKIVKITRPGYNLKSYGYNNLNIIATMKIYNLKSLKELNITLEKDYLLLKNYFLKYYDKIIEPTGFADVQALFDIIKIEIAVNEKRLFHSRYIQQFLSLLWKEDLIATMSNDAKGNLRYIAIKA